MRNKPALIVDALLETDEPGVGVPNDDIEPEEYIARYFQRGDLRGVVNRRTAMTANRFWHRTRKRSDGRTAIEVRRNGRTKTWVRRPNEFSIPVKYGMYGFLTITDKNAHEWTTIEPEPLPKPPRAKKKATP